MQYKALYHHIISGPQYFEAMITYHLAPVVMGIKSAGLVSLCKHKICMRHIKSTLHTMYLKSFVLGETDKKVCVLIYSPSLLKNALQKEESKRFLENNGYIGLNLKKSLKRLKIRYQSYVEGEAAYPHEIGLFLDYPPKDVEDFMKKEKPIKLCGYWKVFNNEQEAKRIFKQYDLARDIAVNEFLKGKSLSFIREIGQIQYRTYCLEPFA